MQVGLDEIDVAPFVSSHTELQASAITMFLFGLALEAEREQDCISTGIKLVIHTFNDKQTVSCVIHVYIYII